MQLEKGLRSRAVSPYAQGHRENALLKPRSDPVMDTLNRKGDLTFESDILALPQKIVLKARWIAKPVSDYGPHAQVFSQGVPKEACRLYDPSVNDDKEMAINSAHAYVKVVYAGSGAIYHGTNKNRFFGLECFPFKIDFRHKEEIYRRNFITQNEPLILRRNVIEVNEWFVTPPIDPTKGAMNLLAFFGYGGYARENAFLTEIQQVYARLDFMVRTNPILRTTAFLRKNNAGPPNGGSAGREPVRYVGTIVEEDLLSLSDALLAGFGQIILRCGEMARVYESTGWTENGCLSPEFNLTFEPKN